MLIRPAPDFVAEQLGKSGHSGKKSGAVIKSIIEALKSQDIEISEDESLDDWVSAALSLFRSQPIVVVDDGREWEDFLLGDVSIRETVRVRPDAYVDKGGHLHNGKVGKVIGTQGRKISVLYEDGSYSSPVLHEHTALQKLVK